MALSKVYDERGMSGSTAHCDEGAPFGLRQLQAAAHCDEGAPFGLHQLQAVVHRDVGWSRPPRWLMGVVTTTLMAFEGWSRPPTMAQGVVQLLPHSNGVSGFPWEWVGVGVGVGVADLPS